MGIHTATGISHSEIQAAFTSAQSDTDAEVIIRFPAGTGNVNNQVNYTSHINNTSVTIECNSGQAILVDTWASTSSWLVWAFSANNVKIRFRNFTIVPGPSWASNPKSNWTSIAAETNNFRATNTNIDCWTINAVNIGHGFVFFGRVEGVFDQCRGDFNQFGGFYTIHYNNPDGNGDTAWAESSNYGGQNKLYTEDCHFESHVGVPSGAVEDTFHGAHFVTRFCKLISVGFQTHPTVSNRGRGGRHLEIYCNDIEESFAEPYFNLLFFSSGTAILWNNVLPAGSYKNVIRLINFRRRDIANGSSYDQIPTPDGWGYAGNDLGLTGDGSNWDGNDEASTGYPCLDMPGRGQGDLIINAFPNAQNQATGGISSSPDAYPRQKREPLLMWQVPWTNPGWGGSYISPSVGGDCFQENRDYYLENTNFVSGGGLTGIGVGTLAQMNSVSAVDDTYFWATDDGDWNDGSNPIYTGQGVLYKRTAGAWVKEYEPLPYPHPIIVADGDGGEPEPPVDPPIPPVLLGQCLT